MSAHPSTEQERNQAALADWKAKVANADRYDLSNALRMVKLIEDRIKRANGEPIEQVKRRRGGFGHWSRRAR